VATQLYETSHNRPQTIAIATAYTAGLLPSWYRYSRATLEPERAQLRILERIIRRNRHTDFGREHDFHRIGSLDAFRSRLPVRRHEAFIRWIDRVRAGEQHVLTTQPVHLFERSGGSTAENKYIPYTRELLREFSAAINPWIFNLNIAQPRMMGTRSYWSISPALVSKTRTSGGIPIGVDDDTEYFDPIKGWALRRLFAVPKQVAELSDPEAWRKATCLYLLATRDLGFISVWSPTFLILLMRYISDNIQRLLGQLEKTRAEEIERAVAAAGALTGPAIWPRLAMISCWTDGSSRSFVTALERWFPGVPLQPKGLLATEGVVSIPIYGQPGSALAVTSHFLEFQRLEAPEQTPVLAHELRVGERYVPILTTSGGLYRYDLKDVVTCVGRYRRTPLIRFEGKLDCVTDICGEKLNAWQVDQALESATARVDFDVAFAILSPTLEPAPHYRLYIEAEGAPLSLNAFAGFVERHLRRCHHFDYCRKLGQLAPLEVVRVSHGVGRYQAEQVNRNKRIGDIKPTALDVMQIAEQVFAKELADRGRTA
jgi:hypothetical protein